MCFGFFFDSVPNAQRVLVFNLVFIFSFFVFRFFSLSLSFNFFFSSKMKLFVIALLFALLLLLLLTNEATHGSTTKKTCRTTTTGDDDDDEWHLFNGERCFKLIVDAKSWFDARVYCHSVGAKLATIDSVGVNDFLVEKAAAHMANYKLSTPWWSSSSTTTLLEGINWWIGLTDVQNETQWVWVDDFEDILDVTLARQLWAPDEPDNGANSLFGTGNNENCAALLTYNRDSSLFELHSTQHGRWADTDCNQVSFRSFFFFCRCCSGCRPNPFVYAPTRRHSTTKRDLFAKGRPTPNRASSSAINGSVPTVTTWHLTRVAGQSFGRWWIVCATRGYGRRTTALLECLFVLATGSATTNGADSTPQ